MSFFTNQQYGQVNIFGQDVPFDSHIGYLKPIEKLHLCMCKVE